MRKVVIIGGGPAGLAAAAFCGRQGDRVLLLERAARFGGRAASDVHARALLNQGPHALYRGGHATRTLHELGVPFRGVVPSTSAFFLERDGVRHIFPRSVTRMLSTRAR